MALSSHQVNNEEVFTIANIDFDFSDTTFVKIPNLEFPVVAGRTYKFKFAFENAISRAPLWGVSSGNIAVATVPNDVNADIHYAEGWLTADVDGVVEINVRNNTGTVVQTVSALSWVEAREVD